MRNSIPSIGKKLEHITVPYLSTYPRAGLVGLPYQCFFQASIIFWDRAYLNYNNVSWCESISIKLLLDGFIRTS